MALSHYDPFQELVIVTDASGDKRASCLMQTKDEIRDDSKIQLLDLSVNPLLFLSGCFNKTQRKWSTSQHEIYPIIYTMLQCNHIVEDVEVVNLFTDHQALNYIFNPFL